jgi:AraC family transcriptional activator of mtrCDE
LEVIERLLANLEVGIGAFACCDIRVGHQLTFESRPAAGVHYCLSGRGALRLKNGRTVRMRRHTFAILPPNMMYSLGANKKEQSGDSPRRRLSAPLFKESVPMIQAGNGMPGILTACGEIRFEGVGTASLFAQLTEPMVEHFDVPTGLQEQFIILLAESARPQFGTRPLTEALLKQGLILLLRRAIARGAPPLPWMAALADARLSRAMQAILQRFSEPLTLERLAGVAGMSRSSFAGHFARCFGKTPMTLLRSVRLSRAKELLATSDLSVAQIARSVGFSSRSNFSCAFREAYGAAPSGFRATSRSV